MNVDEKIAIAKSREYIVSKSNAIVQKSRYSFTLQEQRMIAYICSKIKPVNAVDRANGTPYQLEYDFNIMEYANICGISYSGVFYTQIKASLQGLSEKGMWLMRPDGGEALVHWLNKAIVYKRKGIVKIRIDEDLAPYLFDLKSRFVSYGLKNILNMKSQYSIRIYELIKSYYGLKVGQIDHRKGDEKDNSPLPVIWVIDLDTFKKRIMVDSIKTYASFKELKKRILSVAQNEINTLTDIKVEFQPVKEGRRITKLKIIIISKRPLERLVISRLNDELLD